MDKAIESGLTQLIYICAGVKKDDIALIISDKSTASLGQLIKSNILPVTPNVCLEIIDSFNMHGNEPPQRIAEMMLESTVIFGITKMSMAHTKARKNATDKGARYLSLPDYTTDILARPAMLADFKGLTKRAEKLKSIFTNGKNLVVKTKLGTDICCDISGRNANAAPGWCGADYEMASPPDAETNIAPLENGSNGIIVVDGSVPFSGIGLLETPLTISVKDGLIRSVDGYCEKAYIDIFKGITRPEAKVLAEVGIGLNPEARLCGNMLEDEGCLGTLHFGFGSNCTIGGLNDVGFHLDHVIKNPTVEVDGQILMRDGMFTF